MVLYK